MLKAVDLYRVHITPQARGSRRVVFCFVEAAPSKTELMEVLDTLIAKLQADLLQLQEEDDPNENEISIDNLEKEIEGTIRCREVIEITTQELFNDTVKPYYICVAGVQIGSISIETEEVLTR
jgi:uncharacterized protein with von Willebrand factor type A (vWA) domain